MDLFSPSIDPFDYFESNDQFESFDINKEIDELLFNQTPSTQIPQSSPLRPIDLPSYRKHYGLLTFFTYRIPIIFRLSNNLYVPYIRFSYALNVLDEHQSNRLSPILDMVKNLPILDMTSIETNYYQRLIEALASKFRLMPEKQHQDCSNQLLSVALLDCLLGIVDCSTSFFQNDQVNVDKWQEVLEAMRQEVKLRWTIEEKLVLNQIEKQNRSMEDEKDSICISSTSIAERRLFFEKRLDLSLVEQIGGFVQIDSFIFPYIKYSDAMTIYLHLDDIRHRYHQYLLLSTSYIRRFPSDSAVSQAYHLISEQARENYFWNNIHGNIFMSKSLPNPKKHPRELTFLALDTILQAKGLCFVQLFEQSSLEYITANYRNHIDRQFIISDTRRHGGFINHEIPYLRLRIENGLYETWFVTETKSTRVMTTDERLFINSILLYHGQNRMLLNEKQCWYLEELDFDLLSPIMNLFDKDYFERQQRKLFAHG